MKQKTETYTKITPKEWYQATGEYTEPNTKIIYENEHGDDWIIQITE